MQKAAINDDLFDNEFYPTFLLKLLGGVFSLSSGNIKFNISLFFNKDNKW
jgi:hypothetical protein